MNIEIRLERPEEYRSVEELTREAFWNHFVPGCDEHFLVHILRNHEDFIPELDFVALVDGTIVGNIMYTRATLTDEIGNNLDALTFGPVSVHPAYQRKGIGSALIRHSADCARTMGYPAIIIQGHPYNYCKHGFVGSRSVNVSDSDGRYHYSMLVLELEKGILAGKKWTYHGSEVYNIDGEAATRFDTGFPKREKCWKPSQEEFRIALHAWILDD